MSSDMKYFCCKLIDNMTIHLYSSNHDYYDDKHYNILCTKCPIPVCDISNAIKTIKDNLHYKRYNSDEDILMFRDVEQYIEALNVVQRFMSTEESLYSSHS